MTNPYGLTPLEVQCIEAMIAKGTAKAAARSLNITQLAVSQSMVRVRRRMDAGNTILALFMWDRHTRKTDFLTTERQI